MLEAAPESRCGVVGENVETENAGSVLGALASLRWTAEAAVSTWILLSPCSMVLSADAGEGARATSGASADADPNCSELGVNSNDVAKWGPMPVVFSAASDI